GIPWVGTDLEPTEDFKHVGRLVANRTIDWYEALSGMIDNLANEKYKILQYRWFAEDQDILQNVDKIITTYQSAIDRR
ncbi:MAG: hypothetical protein WBP54_11250, partial [Pelodictyon phaeoclathratiforme]